MKALSEGLELDVGPGIKYLKPSGSRHYSLNPVNLKAGKPLKRQRSSLNSERFSFAWQLKQDPEEASMAPLLFFYFHTVLSWVKPWSLIENFTKAESVILLPALAQAPVCRIPVDGIDDPAVDFAIDGLADSQNYRPTPRLLVPSRPPRTILGPVRSDERSLHWQVQPWPWLELVKPGQWQAVIII